MDLIGAQGEAAARAALSAHEGALARKIEGYALNCWMPPRI